MITLQVRRIANNAPSDPSRSSIKRLATAVTIPCMVFASTIGIYVMYNFQTFGSWEPSYSKTINSMGYSP